jgi:hypothetical protein
MSSFCSAVYHPQIHSMLCCAVSHSSDPLNALARAPRGPHRLFALIFPPSTTSPEPNAAGHPAAAHHPIQQQQQQQQATQRNAGQPQHVRVEAGGPSAAAGGASRSLPAIHTLSRQTSLLNLSRPAAHPSHTQQQQQQQQGQGLQQGTGRKRTVRISGRHAVMLGLLRRMLGGCAQLLYVPVP